MIKQLRKIVFQSFKKNSKPTNVANTLFIEKTMDEVYKLTKADLKSKGYFVTTALLKKYDNYFRRKNIQSVKEI